MRITTMTNSDSSESIITWKGDTSGQYTCLSAIARSVSKGWFKIGGVREYTEFISVGVS